MPSILIEENIVVCRNCGHEIKVDTCSGLNIETKLCYQCLTKENLQYYSDLDFDNDIHELLLKERKINTKMSK